jgi:hypothetical protein
MELKKIEEALLPRSTSHARRKVFVLYGLGGIGKTQLSVEFARRQKESFSAIFWLDGSTRGRVEQSLAAIVRRLPQEQISETSRRFSRGSGADLEAAIKDVLTWLNLPTSDKWLLFLTMLIEMTQLYCKIRMRSIRRHIFPVRTKGQF